MAAPLIYSSSPIKLNSTKLAANSIRLLPNPNNQTFQHSGNLYPSIDALSGALPRIAFKTPIKDAYALIGTGILALTTIEVYAAKFSNSTFAKLGTSVHRKWAGTAGCATITGFSVGQNGIMMADVEVVPFSSDGSTHPLTPTDNNALITLDAEPLLHTLGPISFNGTQITGVDSVSVSLGNNIDIRISDGDLYPRNAALISGAPSISGTHMDPVTLSSTLSLIGVAVSGSSVIVYFKSIDASTQVVSLSNSISLTIASGRIMMGDMSFEQNNAFKTEFSIIPLSSSSANPIIISTSATTPAT